MENLLFETHYWSVVLSHDQRYFGRCAVILKRSCGELSALTTEEFADFLEVVKKYESVMKSEYGAVMFNWSCLMNDAYKNTPPDPQVHWHGRPRYATPLMFQGFKFSDEEFGHHYVRKPELFLDKTIHEAIAAELHSKFSSES